MELLRALLLGGIAFETPDGSWPLPPSSVDGPRFPAVRDRDTANAASYSRKIPAVSYFPGSVRGLAPGSEVTMHGLVVGHVTDVRLDYDRGEGHRSSRRFALRSNPNASSASAQSRSSRRRPRRWPRC